VNSFTLQRNYNGKREYTGDKVSKRMKGGGDWGSPGCGKEKTMSSKKSHRKAVERKSNCKGGKLW